MNVSDNFTLLGDDFIDKFMYPDIDHVLLPIIWPVIIIIGLLGNIATVIVLLRIKQMKTPLNVYLVSLAFSDTLFLLILPALLLASYSNSDIHDNFDQGAVTTPLCKLIVFLVDASFQISNFMILCVTAERYIAICRPIQYREHGTRRRALKITVSVWILVFVYQSRLIWSAAAVNFDLYWPDGYRGLPSQTTICNYCNSISTSDLACDVVTKLYVVDIGVGLLVVGVVVPMYVLMISKLRSSRFTDSQKTRKQTTPDRKVFNTMMVVVAFYVACFIPYRLLNLLSLYSSSFDIFVFTEYSNLFRTPMLINSAINPIIYIIMNTAFRNSFISFVKSPLSTNTVTVMSDISPNSV